MGPSRPASDDLLRPVLDESADPCRMDGVWNPWNLAVLALLGGPLAAGALSGENFRRLGRASRLGWCAAGTLALLVAVTLLVARFADAAPFTGESDHRL